MIEELVVRMQMVCLPSCSRSMKRAILQRSRRKMLLNLDRIRKERNQEEGTRRIKEGGGKQTRKGGGDRKEGGGERGREEEEREEKG